MVKMLILLTYVSLLTLTNSYKFYQDRLPNGHAVIHPCKNNLVWHGVGHMNPQGGGARNPFGKAFASNEYKWTTKLCQADSDGDGRSNGDELGDPNCIWKEGQDPHRKQNITHPGFCDPVDSEMCRSHNTSMCDYTGYNCPAVNGTDVRSISFRMFRTKVPAMETTYMCQSVTFPSNGTYDIIGTQPLIDNQDVMHHMILWACPADWYGQIYATPRKCGMAPSGCNFLLVTWTLGHNGHCFNKNVGLRIGEGGWKYAILQSHWNNPQLLDTYYDTSGYLLYYTPVLRPETLGTLILGVERFIIPPGKKRYTEKAILHRDCSRAYQKMTLKLRQVHLHMHYLGTRAQLEHFRDDKKIGDIAIDSPYMYDFPVFHELDPPVEYRIGDELKLTCEFDSSRQKNETHWGDATSDEMCYALIGNTPYQRELVLVTYRDKVDACTSYLPQNAGEKGSYMGFIGESMCHMTSFTAWERPRLFKKIKAHCNTSDICNKECLNLLQSLRMHACSSDSKHPGLTTYIDRFATPSDTRADKEYADAATESCMKYLQPTAAPKQPCITALATQHMSSIFITILSCFTMAIFG